MDFITWLPKIRDKHYIYVVVDMLTKFTHFFAISVDYSAKEVAELFFKEVFRLHGLPKNIVSDRHTKCICVFWQELFRLMGTKLTPGTSYHPQIHGQTKSVNKWIEGYLRNYVTSQQQAWIKWFCLEENCYNTTYHLSIGMASFRALYGYDAPSSIDRIFGDNKAPIAKHWIQESQDIIKVLKENMQAAQNRQKMYVYQHRTKLIFEVGDLVFLILHPYK